MIREWTVTKLVARLYDAVDDDELYILDRLLVRAGYFCRPCAREGCTPGKPRNHLADEPCLPDCPRHVDTKRSPPP